MKFAGLVPFALAVGLVVPVATPAASPLNASIQAPSDDTLKDRINHRLETSNAVRKYDIKVKVENRVATLSGDVATAAQKAEVERLATIDGVTRIDNQIKIDPNEDVSVSDRIKKKLNKAGDSITDAWITAKVKWFLVGEETLKGQDIDVDVKNGVVTLNGKVRTAAAKQRAGELAMFTDGVTRVDNRLVVTG
jgi:osmotically-inducible protein OsmY